MKKIEQPKKKAKISEYLNPKNLQKEVNRYGYTFSIQTYNLFLLATIVVSIGLSLLFHLQVGYLVAVLISYVLLLPTFILNVYKRMYQQKRYSETIDYIENMLYAFQKNGTILSALQDTIKIFDEKNSQMRSSIQKAIDYIFIGESEENRLYEEALSIIEKDYNNSRIRMIHKFLINIELHGGQFDTSLNILLKDKAQWVKNTYDLQRRKQSFFRITIVAILISLGLSYMILAKFKNLPVTVDIMQAVGVQLSSALVIILDFVILIKSSGKLAVDWLNDEEKYTLEYLERAYKNVTEYDFKAQKKKSIVYSIPFFLITAVLYLLKIKLFTVIFGMISIFVLFSYKLGYDANYNFVKKQVYLAISDWLIEMALLLQSDNVQVAIVNSLVNAPYVLRPEITKMIERLNENPSDINSYTEFCTAFDMPDVKSAMRLLYSISESGSGDVQTQISNLIENNSDIITNTEKIRNDNELVKMRLIFSMPVITCSIKMLIDLMVIMMVLLPSMTQSI